MLRLWCGLGGLSYYPRSNQKDELARFLDRCASVGVGAVHPYFGFAHSGEPTVFRLERGRRPFVPDEALTAFHFYPPSEWDPFKALVEGAHARQISVLGYTSPDFHGSLQPNPHSPLGEKLPQLFLSRFANRHPDFWVRDAEGRDALETDGHVRLSIRFPEVRDHLTRSLARLGEDKMLDGLELEWLCGTTDHRPSEPEAEESYRDAVTDFVRRMQRLLAAEVSLSVAVPDDIGKALRWSYDWGVWGSEGLVDSLVLRHRGQDIGCIAGRVRAARELVGSEVHLVSQLDCWRKNGLRDSSALVEASEAVQEAGADAVGIYRADAVEAFDIWDGLACIGVT